MTDFHRLTCINFQWSSICMRWRILHLFVHDLLFNLFVSICGYVWANDGWISFFKFVSPRFWVVWQRLAQVDIVTPLYFAFLHLTIFLLIWLINFSFSWILVFSSCGVYSYLNSYFRIMNIECYWLQILYDCSIWCRGYLSVVLDRDNWMFWRVLVIKRQITWTVLAGFTFLNV